MKQYIDGFVLPMPKKNLKAYQKMAQEGGNLWMKHGALQYIECVGEDLKSAEKWGCLPFPKMVKTKADEIVVFSFIIFKSRKHRDSVNAKVMKEINSAKWQNKPMPFEMKRMAVGGFETIVNL